MTSNAIPSKTVQDRIAALHRQRCELMDQPAHDQMQTILSHPHPAALVHAYPDEDFYFLINDIGVEDALPLLALASDKQREFIFDISMWQRDRVDLHAVIRWIGFMLAADRLRTIQWLVNKKLDELSFVLFKTIDVAIREHDQPPDELGDDFITFDDVFYYRVKPDTQQAQPLEVIISKLIELLGDHDHILYQRLLLESASVVPCETEEELYRLRNVRLAEKGFLPFDEALGIYQPLAAEQLRNRPIKVLTPADGLIPVPGQVQSIADQNSLFTKALVHVTSDFSILEQLQIEFAGLSNQILSAENEPIIDREQLRRAVARACGYISLGLEKLAGPDADSAVHAQLLKRYALADLFRVGIAPAIRLKWQAEKWRTNSWFHSQGLPLSFWGEDWLGVIGGLLVKRPLFYDNYQTGRLYRDFKSMVDIDQTRLVLDRIIVFDQLLQRINQSCRATTNHFVTFKSFLLTLWAANQLDLPQVYAPVPLDRFTDFYVRLFARDRSGTPDAPQHIALAMKDEFLSWIAERTSLTHVQIADMAGPALASLFDEIESEYGEVAPEHLDPRHIHLFWIRG